MEQKSGLETSKTDLQQHAQSRKGSDRPSDIIYLLASGRFTTASNFLVCSNKFLTFSTVIVLLETEFLFRISFGYCPWHKALHRDFCLVSEIICLAVSGNSRNSRACDFNEKKSLKPIGPANAANDEDVRLFSSLQKFLRIYSV